ncbi:MAG TPA: hypothetical protein VM013_07160, partial [Dehalococcoidia bacterium]|nr:hypothetical protein [Dehalococcoidia bacterium]
GHLQVERLPEHLPAALQPERLPAERLPEHLPAAQQPERLQAEHLPAALQPERLPAERLPERLPVGRQSGHRRGPERRRACREGVAQRAHRGRQAQDSPFRTSVTITTAAERAMRAQRPEPRAPERLASGYWGFSV